MPVADVAQMLSLPESRVHQAVRDGQILSLRRDGEVVVPADFFAEGEEGMEVIKGLAGTITVLRDGGFTDPEILRWLFTSDDTLPGTPMASMQAGRHREIKRRAQAMAF